LLDTDIFNKAALRCKGAEPWLLAADIGLDFINASIKNYVLQVICRDEIGCAMIMALGQATRSWYSSPREKLVCRAPHRQKTAQQAKLLRISTGN